MQEKTFSQPSSSSSDILFFLILVGSLGKFINIYTTAQKTIHKIQALRSYSDQNTALNDFKF